MKNRVISELFEKSRKRYGLRGDVHLWEEFCKSTQNFNLPETSDDSLILLHQKFEEITGEKTEPGKDFFDKKYDLGGMPVTMFWGRN